LAPERAPPPQPGDGRAPDGIAYPEWDHERRAYVRDAVTVREPAPADGDAAWADGVLAAHAPWCGACARASSRCARGARGSAGQRRGDEVDLAAFVDAHADRCAGRGGDGDERLYVATSPARARSPSWCSST
jgi:nitric oxide reductase NorD protein